MVDKTVTQETQAGAIQPADLFRGVQGGLTVKFSMQQIKDFVASDEIMTASGQVANGDVSLIVPIPVGYDIVDIDLTDFQLSAVAHLDMVVSVNGGSVYITAGYQYNFNVTSAAIADVNSQSVNNAYILVTGYQNNGVEGSSASIRIPNPSSATHHKRFRCNGLYKDNAGNNSMIESFAALENTSPITHLKFFPSVGSFVAGTYMVRAGKK